MTVFPWARAMEIGLGQLRLGTREFWRMTLPELSAAARGAGHGGHRGAMTRRDLMGLSRAFPDEVNPVRSGV